MALPTLTRFPEDRPLSADDLIRRRVPLIGPTTPVGSMGSCFARVIKDHLIEGGYNYVQTSDHPAARHGSAAWERVYNVPCIRQEFDRAFGTFHPMITHWPDGESRLDPYRAKVAWASGDAMASELSEHAKNAERAIAQSRVFIITLGLNECWMAEDTSVAAQMPPERFRAPWKPWVPDHADLMHELFHIRRRLTDISPDCVLIVSVSPVPLRATFRNMSAMEADALSKASLRLAASMFVEKKQGAHYFPAFELVRYVLRDPWQDDNRHVTPEAERAVMDLFRRMYCK